MSMYVYKWVSGLLVEIFSVGVKLVKLCNLALLMATIKFTNKWVV